MVTAHLAVSTGLCPLASIAALAVVQLLQGHAGGEGFRVWLSSIKLLASPVPPIPRFSAHRHGESGRPTSPARSYFYFFVMSCWLLRLPEGRDGWVVSGCQRCSPARWQVQWGGKWSPGHVLWGLWAGKWISAASQNHVLEISPFASHLVMIGPWDGCV